MSGGSGDREDLDLDLEWPASLPGQQTEMWPERRRSRLTGRRGKRERQDGPTAPEAGTPGGASNEPAVPPKPEPTPSVPLPAADPVAAVPPDGSPAPAEDRPRRRLASRRAARSATPEPTVDPPAPAAEEAPASPPPADPAPTEVAPTPAPSDEPEEATEAAPPAARPVTRAGRQPISARSARVGGAREPSTVDLERLRSLQDQATVEILDAVGSLDETLSRIEQISSALAAEMAEIAQVICDESERHATTTRDEVRTRLDQLGADIETLGETVADSIAGLRSEDGKGGDAQQIERHLKQLGQGTDRVEALLEDLLVVTEERPTDVSELTARTLERLGMTVGAKVEAVTTNAVASIEEAVDKALARAAQQFKDLAPPVVDRSTTSALVRLEERVAELSRQREADEAGTKEVLESLGATVARLASAQAEDLERVLDTIEATRQPGTEERDDRVGKLAASLDAIADLPATTDELVSAVSEQTAAFNAQMEAVRRRLALRARTGLDRQTLEQLADQVADRLRVLG